MSTRDQLRQAMMTGCVAGLRGVLRTNPDPEREARQRAEWPELWERIDRLVELIDWSQ